MKTFIGRTEVFSKDLQGFSRTQQSQILIEGVISFVLKLEEL